MICGFIPAFLDRCTNEVPCPKHSHLECCVCKEPATHECDTSMGLCCGCPLCDNCEHGEVTFGLGVIEGLMRNTSHRKKDSTETQS